MAGAGAAAAAAGVAVPTKGAATEVLGFDSAVAAALGRAGGCGTGAAARKSDPREASRSETKSPRRTVWSGLTVATSAMGESGCETILGGTTAGRDLSSVELSKSVANS